MDCSGGQCAAIGIVGTSQDPINYGPPNLSFTNFGNLVDGNPVTRRDQSSAIRDTLTIVMPVFNEAETLPQFELGP